VTGGHVTIDAAAFKAAFLLGPYREEVSRRDLLDAEYLSDGSYLKKA